jgi:hypothetical protein
LILCVSVVYLDRTAVNTFLIVVIIIHLVFPTTDSRPFPTKLLVFSLPPHYQLSTLATPTKSSLHRLTDQALTLSLAYNILARTTYKTPFLCCMRIRCSGNVFTEPFPSSVRLFLLRIFCLATDVVPLFVLRPLPRNECCFRAFR